MNPDKKIAIFQEVNFWKIGMIVGKEDKSLGKDLLKNKVNCTFSTDSLE